MDDVVNRLEKNLTLNKVSLALEALESLDNVMPILERMPNLINLDLHGNKLSKLPRDLSKLKKLSTLNLRHNNFASVKAIIPSLASLPSLRALHVDSTTDEEEEALIIGLPNMSVFNGTNLHGDEDGNEDIYSRTIRERRDSRDEQTLQKQHNENNDNNNNNSRKNNNTVEYSGNDSVSVPITSNSSVTSGTSTYVPSQHEIQSGLSSMEGADAKGISANDITEVETLFNELKNLRSSISRTEDARLSNMIKNHIQETTSELTSKLNAMNDTFMKRREVTAAKANLYDVCFEEAINYAMTSENPNLGVALRKLRLNEQNVLLEYGGLINAMHIHYIERLRGVNQQLKNAESENSMLLNAAEALEKEAFQHNEEMARLKSQCEKLTLDNRQLNRMLEESENQNTSRQQQQQRRTVVPGPPPPPPEQRYGNVPSLPSSNGMYGTNVGNNDGRGGVYNDHLGPSVRTLPSSFHRATGPPPRPGATPGGGAFGPSRGPPKSAEKPKQKIRILSLKQLKENFINLIYESKIKFDKKCGKNHLPRETMEQHMYTFLNQRYGLKSLIIEHASAVIKAVNKYHEIDNDVAVFGKILRNEIDEEFRFVQKQLKDTVVELLRVYLKGKMPMKTDAAINRILKKRLFGDVEEEEWVDIIKYMYNHDDGLSLMVLVKDAIRDLPVGKAKNPKKNNKFTRRRGSMIAMQDEQESIARSGRIPYRLFLKVLLDFQLKGHDKFLSRFRRLFRDVDTDRNGVLNEDEFRQFVVKVDPNKSLGEMDEILALVDPWTNQNITFSEAVGVLSADLVAMMTVGNTK